MAEPELLHLYGQGAWHDEARIVGNRAGLVRLRAAIDAALGSGKGEARVFAADGEGYAAMVDLVDAPWRHPYWAGMLRPYTEEIAQSDGFAPWVVTGHRDRERSGKGWPPAWAGAFAEWISQCTAIDAAVSKWEAEAAANV